MPELIDWHAHHTPPEIVDKFFHLTGRRPREDPCDSPDFSKRIEEMDACGLDRQLVCQGAGVYADGLPAAEAMALVRQTNDLIAERVAPHARRLTGIAAVSLKDVPGSVEEVRRMVEQGFCAVLLYSGTDGEVTVDRPEIEPLFAEIAARNLPIFLHGSGFRKDPTLDALEDKGAGVRASAFADASVTECVVRMIASGVFDRHPNLQVVIRSGGGGLPLLLNKLFWKHKGPRGEQRYADIFLEHFLVDTASVNLRILQFLLETLGEERVVFGTDYCGGSGPLKNAVALVDEFSDPGNLKSLTERNSRRLLQL